MKSCRSKRLKYLITFVKSRYGMTIPPRYEMAVYCQDIYYGRLRCLYVQSDINYVFIVPKNSIHGLEMSIPVKFRFISGGISAEKKYWKKFIVPKYTSVNFRGVSWAVFEISCWFPPLSAYKTILAVYCQLVPWLLSTIGST